MSDIIRKGQRGGLVPILDPRLRGSVESSLTEYREPTQPYDGEAPSMYTGIAPKYTPERAAADAEKQADAVQQELMAAAATSDDAPAPEFDLDDSLYSAPQSEILAELPDEKTLSMQLTQAAKDKPARAARRPQAKQQVAQVVAKRPEARPQAAQMNAGPEALKPGPGEELQEGAPQAAQARAKPVPVPAGAELRERYLKTVWPQIGNVAEQHGVTLDGLRDLYNNDQAQGKSHREAVLTVKAALDAVRMQAATLGNKARTSRLVQDAEGRRLGVHPQAYALYKSMETATPEQRLASLIALHHQNPYMGYGNLAALDMRNQAAQNQAQALAGQQKPDGVGAFKVAIDKALAPGATPATMDALRNVHLNTPLGKNDVRGAEQFAINQSTPLYRQLHGAQALTPEQEQFVRQWVSSFTTYQDFLGQIGAGDSPANRAWYQKYTGRDPRGMLEWMGDVVGNAAPAVANPLGAAWRFMTGGQQQQPQPAPNNVAGNQRGQGGK
jgi:hypothetical protein